MPAECTSCQPGMHGAAPNIKSSQSCPTTGYYTLTSGQSSCTICPIGTYASSTGMYVCANCAVGNYTQVAGMPLCDSCAAGTYASLTGMTICVKCAIGTYTQNTGQSSCGLCAAGTFGNTSGQTSCVSCKSGTYSTALGIGHASPSQLTWLFRNNETGYYYLNFTSPQTSMRFFGSPQNTVWSKIRFNSTLNYTSTVFQMYVRAVDNPTVVCGGTTIDATYASRPSTNGEFTNFGEAASCGLNLASSPMSLAGLPFSLSSNAADWYMPSSVCATGGSSYSCSDAQTCVVRSQGNCGYASWLGKMYVFDTAAYQADIATACALYGSSEYLSCKEYETMPSCQACPAGTFSTEGASSCTTCPVGTHNPNQGMTYCMYCTN